MRLHKVVLLITVLFVPAGLLAALPLCQSKGPDWTHLQVIVIGFAPDLLIGYRRGYHSSGDSTLGTISAAVFSDNDSAWSVDHCMAANEVPGVIFANRAIVSANPSLIDVGATILREFGLQPPDGMAGRNLLAAPPLARSGTTRKE